MLINGVAYKNTAIGYPQASEFFPAPKWIVITSIQYPTEDVKVLISASFVIKVCVEFGE